MSKSTEKTKTVKKNSKNFETTTKININDTFDENEVTLIEKNPEQHLPPLSERDDEDSVTVKLKAEVTSKDKTPRVPRIKEPSSVSYKLKRIEAGLYEKKAHLVSLDKIKDFTKFALAHLVSFFVLCFSYIKTFPLKKRTVKVVLISIAALVLLILSILLIKTMIGSKGPTTTTLPLSNTKPLSSSGTSNLKLSPLTFHDEEGIVLNRKKIQAGNSFSMDFFVIDWQKNNRNKVELDVDIRIYSGNGQLIVFQPGYLVFSDHVDEKKEKIEVSTTLNLSKDIPVGFYRIIINAIDRATQKVASLQARIKINP